MPSPPSKLQRWTDLLAALLIRRFPATFDELARDIPAYSGKGKSTPALTRMFERDKDELREFVRQWPVKRPETTDAAGDSMFPPMADRAKAGSTQRDEQ